MSDFLERMPDFLPTWDHSGMNAGTWVVVIAAVTLYFNWQYTRRAQEQTKLQRQFRIDAAQPYVWADIVPDEVSGTLLYLAVGNSGQTVAIFSRVEAS